MDFEFQRAVLIFAAVAAASQFVLGHLFGPYAVGHVRGSFEEIVDVGVTTALVSVGIFVWSIFAVPLLVPQDGGLTAGAFALMAMFAIRFIVRDARTLRALVAEIEGRWKTHHPLLDTVEVPRIDPELVRSIELRHPKEAVAQMTNEAWAGQTLERELSAL